MPSTRRTLLAALAGVAAGCASAVRDDTGPTTPAATTGAPTATSTPPAELRLEPARVDEVDGPLTVYPAELADWLREAARTGGPVRGHAEVPAYAPEPVLPALDRVALRGDGAVAGSYAVDAAGGPRYRHLAGAERVDEPPEGEEAATDVDDLPDERRALALAAIAEDGSPRVYPETELGTWVRTEFYGGTFRHEGAYYRGHEVQQTDAAFFSREVWYVLSLSPVDGDGTVLRLAEVDPAVRTAVDRAVGGERTPAEGSASGPFPPAVRSFAAETAYLMTHTAVYAVSLSG